MLQWKKIQLMLILEILMGLKSKQGDVAAVFIHADIPENEKVYVEIPRRFDFVKGSIKGRFLFV